MLFKDILNEFIEFIYELKLKNYSNKTINSYISDMNLFFYVIKEKYTITQLEELTLIIMKIF
ncbi:hypothetical protein CDLVIII_4114 [Clostridium sp. DL-VIII]|uniref:hypothetical protein n=1 Tax=Clostridium sp. DL-VIII TaxID=641107 RepID=UPI00023AFA37|nr:hypothetical protein [Clostridium sp. DL-VIII]EHJ00647.1 hypothetical protein CDLVIII_4114 [Clostridium sp. DL-VIII]